MTDASIFSRLDKDLRAASKTLGDNEIRYLVDAYYQIQENRIRADSQVRTMNEEPHALFTWLGDSNRQLETNIKLALDVYSHNHPVGAWIRSIKGMGPVTTSGLLAMIDIERAPTVGHIWAYAGYDPNRQRKKGEKLSFNPKLKTLCWKIGESFIKVSGIPDAFYGQVYRERKDLETAKNEAGAYAEQAAHLLATKKYSKDTDAFKLMSQGKLAKAHIHARARRYAVKLFLAHLHEVWYTHHYGKAPPLPYPIAILGHAHYIAPPR